MPRHALLPMTAALAAVVLSVPTAAQSGGCSPWPKWGLHRIPWDANSSLEVGSVATGDRALALRFAGHPDAGVVLETIGHRSTRKDGTVTRFDYQTAPPTGLPPSLWKAVFRPQFAQTEVELRPDADDEVRVWVDDCNAPTLALFSWADTELEAPLADSRFWFELLVHIDCNDPARAVWHSRLGRVVTSSGGEPYSLDEVHAPIVHVRQPGSGLLSRLLVPIAQNTLIPAENLPMAAWEFYECDVELQHPSKDQQMQFTAVFSSDPAEIPNGAELLTANRKILYMTTEDTTGHFKKFAHCVVRADGTLYYRWAPIYYPVYGFSPFLNFHVSPYPVAMEALQASTDSFWYDVTDRYRRFVERDVRPTPIWSRRFRGNPDFPRSSILMATSNVGGVATDLPFIADNDGIYSIYTDAALLYRRTFTGATGQETPFFMEWQKWLKGDPDTTPFVGRIVEDPIGPEFNPRPYSGAAEAYQEPPVYVIDEIDRAYQNDINMSVYTGPLAINDGDWTSFRDDWFLRERDGSYVDLPLGSTGRLIDYGYLAVPFWMATNLYDDIFDTIPSMGGIFMDVIAGGGSFLRYAPDPANLFGFRRYNGGDSYVRGVRLLADLTRARIGFNRPTNRHPDIPFVLGETVQEGIVGKFDFGQQGLKSVPMQQQLFTFSDLIFGVPSFSAEISNPSPPLWNAVYHEYQAAQGLTVPLSTLAVSGLLGGGQPIALNPRTGAPFGVTWQTWGDYMRMVHALWWFQGMKPMSFQYLLDLEPWQLIVERNGQPDVLDPSVPQQVQLIAFMKRLHESIDREAEAGRFLQFGRMERPLQTPQALDPLSVAQISNPGFAIDINIDPSLPFAFHFYENPISKLPYPIPTVFHQVWRDPRDGTLGIVFVNWSDQIGFWQGVFDPSCYEGLGDDFVIKGLTPNGAGVTEYVVGQGSGSTPIAWNPFVPGAIGLRHHADPSGFMPPRSVQVFVVQPAN